MFFYQAVIMLAVIVLIFILIYAVKIKSHLILAVVILTLAALGAGGICLVQSVFSSHYYEQKIDVATLKNLKFTQEQKNSLNSLFRDYGPVTDIGENYVTESDATINAALTKTYKVSGGGAKSQVTVTIYLLESTKSADQLFSLTHSFYKNRNFIAADSKLSVSQKGLSHRYITTYIKSTYPDYKELMYLPSKITYLSDVVVQDSNVIVEVREKSNRPVTNKDQIISQIEEKLSRK